MRLQRADGEVREIRVSTAPGRYDGQDIGQAVVIDVTPVEELRADLQREERFVENALDALHDVFYVIDADGRLLRWNDALLERSGYDEDEVRRVDVTEFFVEADADRVDASVAEAIADGETVFEATVRTKSGARIPYEFRKRRLHLEDDRVVLVGIGRDVSERRAHDRHLQVVDRLLQHNLRNQLNVVQGSTQLLREDDGLGDRESLDRIDTAVDRLLSMFENHRYIVELLSGASERNTYDVVPVVERVAEAGREAHRSAEIGVDAPETATVTAVPVLDRAVRELVDNAVEHNDRSSPAVTVTVEVGGEVVRVRVADDGPPIPEMERNVVTGDLPTTSTYHSEGLGLWFVHWVADRSGGTVSFESNDPRGNVVRIELPRGSADAGPCDTSPF
jgi:PAS domain S-box-containing protein